MIIRSKAGVFKPKVFHAVIPEPTTVREALASPDWKRAMQLEFNALLNNQTWVLVPRTGDMNIIMTKWLFRAKYLKDGSVERLKARLVARGFQ